MKFEKITIQPLYPTGNFTNIRIGVDISLEGNDDPKVAMATALDLANEFHKEKFPDLYKENKPIYQGEEKIPDVQVEKPEPKLTKEEKQKKLITDCTKLEKPDGLLSFELLVSKNPHLKETYDKQMELLTNKKD